MPILTATLTRVSVKKTDDSGNIFKSKNGKEYARVGLQINDGRYAEKWLSGFIYQKDDLCFNWKEGDSVKIKVEENGQWLNWSHPTNFDYLKEKFYQLEDRVKLIEAKVFTPTQIQKTNERAEIENFQDDIPWS